MCAVFVSSFRSVRRGSCFAHSQSAGGCRFPFPLPFPSVLRKNGGGFLSPSPSPVLVEPVPYLDDEAHEGDGEGDFHGDG